MGEFAVKSITNNQERSAFYKYMLRDLEAFERMLKEGIIKGDTDHIGAEQEICIIDKSAHPKTTALEILSIIEDKHFTNELALYNLEINLDPKKLNGNCFSTYESEILNFLEKGREKAAIYDSKLFITGILPSLNFRHLYSAYMTPEDRYKLLSEELLSLRGKDFEIYLQGVDDLNASLNSVLFEACNTSFQLHLQIKAEDFSAMHNWAQMISGPVLASCTNSPLLFGRELWSENRIALFKQSLDTRATHNYSRIKLPRVYFGNSWLEGSPSEIWRNEIIRFPVLLRRDMDSDPVKLLKKGIVPNLNGIRLHNGTTYTWNRLCYGIYNNTPHIRIECRYLPAGPSPVDEIANFAFWIGLMKGHTQDQFNFHKKINFKVVKDNFIRAARYGLESVFNWKGKKISAQSLILDTLLPIAHKGLSESGVIDSDRIKYLGIIQKRVEKMRSGSIWQVQNYRNLRTAYNTSHASKILVLESLPLQEENIPIHDWPDLEKTNILSRYTKPKDDFELVEDIMKREVISLKENTDADIALKVMQWKGFHHIPVESIDGHLVGLASEDLLKRHDTSQGRPIKEFMIKKVVSISPEATIASAKNKLAVSKINCLPVVENGLLVGIITTTDLT